jgi:hypothetical protein
MRRRIVRDNDGDIWIEHRKDTFHLAILDGEMSELYPDEGNSFDYVDSTYGPLIVVELPEGGL